MRKDVLYAGLMLAACCGAGSSAFGQPDCMACGIVPGMDDRIVPMVQSLWSDEGKDGVREQTFHLSASDATHSYSLLIAVDDPSAPMRISINGEELGGKPIQTPQGLWHFVDTSRVREGANSISIERLGGKLHSADHAVLFSLDKGAEDMHFNHFVKGFAPRVQPPVDPSQAIMDVLHVDLDITLNMDAATIPAANATITARSLDNSLDQCVLDLDDNGGLLVVSAVDDGSGNTLTFTHNGALERLFIDLPAAVPAGNDFTVRVFYSGTPRTQLGDEGLFRSTHSGVPIVYTNSQAYSARLWWPCKDIPADKFTINTSITVPDQSFNGWPLIAVTNGRLVSTDDNGATLTYNWEESFPVASYLVAITASNFRPAEGVYTALDGVTTMPMIHYVYPESYAAEAPELPNTISLMDWFADTFGEYPFLSEKYATVTWPLTYGLEHQTITSMPNLQHASPFSRRSIHELAHMWFGDFVTYRDYSHLWLGEGWATYCEALAFGFLNGEAAYFARLNELNLSTTRPVVDVNQDNFDTPTFRSAYNKGAWVLHMLRKVVGDDDFFAATRLYLQTNAYDVADSADFQAAFETQTGLDLDYFFDQWLYRPGRPSYEWGFVTSQDGPDTIVNLVVNQVQTDPVYTMPIDIVVTFADTSTETFVITNNQLSQGFELNVGPRVVSNVQFDPQGWILKFATQIASPGTPSDAPTLLSVQATTTPGDVEITWFPTGEAGVTGYRIYRSATGVDGWSVEANVSTATNVHTVSGVGNEETVFFRVAAVEINPGPFSDVYGVRRGNGAPRALVVDAYDRWNDQTTLNPDGLNHAFSASHGRAIAANAWGFDSCANEAAGFLIPLTDYDAVVWFCGDESTADESFSATEQGVVSAYLDGGGRLFTSGNEIGWDLGRTSRPQADQDFYAEYLKGVYVRDRADEPIGSTNVIYTAGGTGAGSLFGFDAYTYGNGGDSPYLPGWPDEIDAIPGAGLALEYLPGRGAGVWYEGLFGTGTTPGKVVYTGFSFETIYPEAARHQFMKRVLDAFVPPTTSINEDTWSLF